MQTALVNVSSITKRGVWPQPRARAEQWRRVEVILKIAEVCNLNCSYCYFFHGGDNSFEEHPNFMSPATAQDMVAFFARTARESDLRQLQIDFHGGEPLMLQKHKFEELCRLLTEGLSFIPDFQLAIQTNGTLITDEWIEIFSKYNVAVGLSLDGSKEQHDVMRVDHKGRGSYDDTVRGLRLIQQAFKDGRLKATAAVSCVVSERHDPVEVIRHMVDELQVYTFNLVIPMFSHDNVEQKTVEWAKKFMLGAFEEWIRRRDRNIHIRFIDRFLTALVGGADGMAKRNLLATSDTALTVSSNGELGGSDDERVSAGYAFGTGHFATGEHSLTDFYATEGMKRYLRERSEPATTCKSCVWMDVCRAGDGFGSAVERHSNRNGFDNPSVYCEAYKAVLVRMTRYALEHGVPFAKIEEVLRVEAPATA
jgi:uncharacterized protein